MTVSHPYTASRSSESLPRTDAAKKSELMTSPMREFLPNSNHQGSILTLYDLKSKFIAYRTSFGTRKFNASAGTAIGESIQHIVSEWGELFIVTDQNHVYRY